MNTPINCSGISDEILLNDNKGVKLSTRNGLKPVSIDVEILHYIAFHSE